MKIKIMGDDNTNKGGRSSGLAKHGKKAYTAFRINQQPRPERWLIMGQV